MGCSLGFGLFVAFHLHVVQTHVLVLLPAPLVVFDRHLRVGLGGVNVLKEASFMLVTLNS